MGKLLKCAHQMKTSPNSTSVMLAWSPEDDLKSSAKPCFEPFTAGSFCRHIPVLASAMAVKDVPLKRVVTVAPGTDACPKIMACFGARCSTMCDPNAADKKDGVGLGVGGVGGAGVGCLGSGVGFGRGVGFGFGEGRVGVGSAPAFPYACQS